MALKDELAAERDRGSKPFDKEARRKGTAGLGQWR
jgi:hypothetical protein